MSERAPKPESSRSASDVQDLLAQKMAEKRLDTWTDTDDLDSMKSMQDYLDNRPADESFTEQAENREVDPLEVGVFENDIFYDKEANAVYSIDARKDMNGESAYSVSTVLANGSERREIMTESEVKAYLAGKELLEPGSDRVNHVEAATHATSETPEQASDDEVKPGFVKFAEASPEEKRARVEKVFGSEYLPENFDSYDAAGDEIDAAFLKTTAKKQKAAKKSTAEKPAQDDSEKTGDTPADESTPDVPAPLTPEDDGTSVPEVVPAAEDATPAVTDLEKAAADEMDRMERETQEILENAGQNEKLPFWKRAYNHAHGTLTNYMHRDKTDFLGENQAERNKTLKRAMAAVAIVGLAFATYKGFELFGPGSDAAEAANGNVGSSGTAFNTGTARSMGAEEVVSGNYTVPAGGGGEQLLGANGAVPEKWYPIENELLQRFPDSFYTMQDGHVGIQSTGELPYVVQDFIDKRIK
jgi:hypothetical protein